VAIFQGVEQRGAGAWLEAETGTAAGHSPQGRAAMPRRTPGLQTPPALVFAAVLAQLFLQEVAIAQPDAAAPYTCKLRISSGIPGRDGTEVYQEISTAEPGRFLEVITDDVLIGADPVGASPPDETKFRRLSPGRVRVGEMTVRACSPKTGEGPSLWESWYLEAAECLTSVDCLSWLGGSRTDEDAGSDIRKTVSVVCLAEGDLGGPRGWLVHNAFPTKWKPWDGTYKGGAASNLESSSTGEPVSCEALTVSMGGLQLDIGDLDQDALDFSQARRVEESPNGFRIEIQRVGGDESASEDEDWNSVSGGQVQVQPAVIAAQLSLPTLGLNTNQAGIRQPSTGLNMIDQPTTGLNTNQANVLAEPIIDPPSYSGGGRVSTRSVAGAGSCEHCDVGPYRDTDGTVRCNPCERGKFAAYPSRLSKRAPAACATCPAGTLPCLQRGSGEMKCTTCAESAVVLDEAVREARCAVCAGDSADGYKHVSDLVLAGPLRGGRGTLVRWIDEVLAEGDGDASMAQVGRFVRLVDTSDADGTPKVVVMYRKAFPTRYVFPEVRGGGANLTETVYIRPERYQVVA